MAEIVLVTIALAGVGIWAFMRARIRRPREVWRKETSVGSMSIVTSATLTKYDPNAYRFDGLASPEFRITYKDNEGDVTVRDIFVHRWYEKESIAFYECWCFAADERRTFRSDRMLEIRNLATGRRIRNIAKYVTR